MLALATLLPRRMKLNTVQPSATLKSGGMKCENLINLASSERASVWCMKAQMALHGWKRERRLKGLLNIFYISYLIYIFSQCQKEVESLEVPIHPRHHRVVL
jgi:hypothetical protein